MSVPDIRTDRTPISASIVLLATLLLPGCRRTAPAAESEGAASLQMQSSDLHNGQFAALFTCNGANTSPALQWSAPPEATKSLALILNDPDALGGSFVHWVLFDLPPSTLSLAEAVPTARQLPDGSRQGRNDFGDIGYGGPCPPGHAPHHYFFTLFALDTKLNLPPGSTRDEVEAAMKGHVLVRGKFTATFGR